MKNPVWLSIACLCLIVTVVACADDLETVQKILQSSYDKSDAAFSSKDIEGYLSIYADDYVSLEDGGYVSIHSKKELRKETRREIKANKLMQHSQIQSIMVQRNKAVVIVQSDYAKNGQLQEYIRHRDLWRKVNNRWKLKQSYPMD